MTAKSSEIEHQGMPVASGARDAKPSPPIDRSPKARTARSNSLVLGCLTALRLAGCVAWRQNNIPVPLGNGRFRRASVQPGIPDILACAPGGRLVAVECKSGTGRLSEGQRLFLTQLVECGALVAVIHRIEDMVELTARAERFGWSAPAATRDNDLRAILNAFQARKPKTKPEDGSQGQETE